MVGGGADSIGLLSSSLANNYVCATLGPGIEAASLLTSKASILERMVEIWNAAPRNASESAPPWCAAVPAVDQPFSVISPEYRSFWEDEPGSPAFAKRNIFAPKAFMFFV